MTTEQISKNLALITLAAGLIASTAVANYRISENARDVLSNVESISVNAQDIQDFGPIFTEIKVQLQGITTTLEFIRQKE